MRALIAVSIAAGLSMAGAEAWSQDLSGQLIAPAPNLPMRASPPSMFFTPPGDQIGATVPKQEYRILEQRRIPTIFGGQQWLKIENAQQPEKRGWIYSGSGDDPAANFKFSGQE